MGVEDRSRYDASHDNDNQSIDLRIEYGADVCQEKEAVNERRAKHVQDVHGN